MPQRSCLDCGTRFRPGDPSRCPDCATTHHARRTRRHAARRNSAPGTGARRRLRTAINNIGGATCHRCQRWHPAQMIEIDHIVSLADGGHDTDTNVQPLCVPHHRAKTAAENQARAARG